MTETTVLKIKMLKEMNDFVLDVIGDDDATEIWLINGVPDACDDEMYQFIAETYSCWMRVIETFAYILKNFERIEENIEEIPF